jgi:excisionase family DNA binding protein
MDPTDPADDRRLRSAQEGLSIKKAAERLGVHYQTVRAWVNTGKVPVTRFGPTGGIVRIHPADADDLIRSSGGSG